MKSHTVKNGLPKLSEAATQALAHAKIFSLSDLANHHEDEIKNLHGIGPNTLKQLQASMKKNGVVYARNPRHGDI